MEALFVLVASFGLLWVLFIWPRQRQVRAHQLLVASLEVGDEVILSAGIYGRIVAMEDDDVWVTVAPGVDLHVARQAVLRRVEPVDDGTVGVVVEVDEPRPEADTGDQAEPPGPDTDPPASEMR
ncbi:MAG TPA: preprotein translocase subunit YajC [Acidimicrobiales bacterium]